MDKQAEKDKTERVTRLGKKTREEIVKWNQMTALASVRNHKFLTERLFCGILFFSMFYGNCMAKAI